ncbi:PACE efflux transporter [Vibrio sp. HN007]|uniref:PACE efflux transporter n=1 Tax=Vibrio iocasae TaxID=3098914 RepID=UPI0035D44E8E
MRTSSDRIRHAVGFEVIGLILTILLGQSLLGLEAKDLGIIGIAMSLFVTVYNYFYNLVFDKVMNALHNRTEKTFIERIIHSVLFEGGLIIITVPILAWFLNISLLHALMMDIGLAIFYVFYAFAYNWAYDRAFPIPSVAH